MLIQIAVHFVILMILTQSCFYHIPLWLLSSRLWYEKCTWKLTHAAGSVSRECVTVLYCHVCNVAMELGAKPLVTHGSYSEGVVLTVSIWNVRKYF